MESRDGRALRRSRLLLALSSSTVLFALFAAPSRPVVDGASGSCARLAAAGLQETTITSTELVAAGDSRFSAAHSFCRVTLTIAPTIDSDIRVEVWLPVDGWNGRFQAVGNGDAAGVISYQAMARALDRGYATSSTDTGHAGNSMAFALGHREKYIDFGYRAVHQMTVKAKAILTMFYGTAPRVAIWNGCSQGGRQGVTEAARYPADYDAIIAGAPALDYMELHAARMALNVFVHRSLDSYIPPEKYPAIHRAALGACDAADGVKDGSIEDPRHCRFDPGVLRCADGDAPSCLTAEQIETARGLYTPITDRSTGRVVAPALLEPGSELGWARLAGPEPLRNAIEPFKYVVFEDPKWDWRAFNLVADLPRALRTDGGVINLTDPNLKPFFDRGGKLLMYHGWADPQITPLNSVKYFNDVLTAVGDGARGRSIELYMEPGVSHCWGGDGPDTFDAIGAVDQWMESGVAPARIVASHWTDAGVDRTRPLCPFPQVATYKGVGSINAAENFRCAAGAASDRDAVRRN